MCSHSSGLVRLCLRVFVLLPFFDPLLGLFDAGFIGRRTVSFPLVDPFLRSFLFLGGTADLVLVFFPVVDPFLGIRTRRRRMWSMFFRRQAPSSSSAFSLHRRRPISPFQTFVPEILLSHPKFSKYRFGRFCISRVFLRVFRPGAFFARDFRPSDGRQQPPRLNFVRPSVIRRSKS